MIGGHGRVISQSTKVLQGTTSFQFSSTTTCRSIHDRLFRSSPEPGSFIFASSDEGDEFADALEELYD